MGAPQYQLFFEYANNAPTSPLQTAEWRRLVKVTALNNAIDYCAPTASTCSGLSTSWPTAAFSVAGVDNKFETVTDALGSQTRITSVGQSFSPNQVLAIRRPTSTTDDHVSISYDALVVAGVARRTGPASSDTWTYTYGATGTVVSTPLTSKTSKTNAAGQIISTTDGAGQNTAFQYDTAGRITRVTQPEGNYVQFTYDARGNITETRRVAKPGSGLADVVTTATYPASCTATTRATCNQPTSTTDAAGQTTDYTYFSHGGLATVTLPDPDGTGPLPRPQTRYTYAALQAWYRQSAATTLIAGPAIQMLTDVSTCATTASCANGADETRTVITYGAANTQNNLVPTQVTVRAGNNAVASTEAYGYDAVRNLVSVDGPLSGTADTSRTYYDLNRRVTGTASPDPDGAGALRIRASRITYNADNQPTVTEVGSIAASDLTIAPASWTTFRALEKTETTYDFAGRAVRATAFGRLVHTDAWTRHGVVDQAYDVAWRPTCSTVRMNPAVFGSLPANACTLSTQGANGADRITHQAYDAVSRPTVTTSAYGTPLAIAETSLGYSPNGQVATITDAGGNRTTRVYDGHDRLSQLRYPSPTTVNTSSTTDYEGYTYHPTNARLASTRLRDATTITYGYDNLGRVTTETPSSNAFATTTAYDNYSRVTSLVSNGQTLSYAYDQLSRLTSETQPLGAVSYLYDAAGRRTRLTYPGGLYIGYDVNVVGEVTALRENGAGSGVGVLAQYAYDDLGRRTSLTRGNGTTETYTYDLASRLASLVTNLAATTHDRTLSMSYNEADQIVSRNNTNTLFAWSAPSSSTTYADNGLNQYTTVGTTAQSYDLRGNLTTGGFLYDAYNRLTSGPNSAALVYDPSGRLARTQSASSAATRFLYDGVDLIGEYNASGTLLRRYVHGPGSDEPIVWYEGTGTTDRRWLVQDELGTVVAIANASGAATGVNKYDVYGVPGASNTGRFGFTGQVWLPELGLYHYKARAYSPTLGRFLQTDPIGFDGGMNLYAYVANDPLNAVDPTGLDPITVTFDLSAKYWQDQAIKDALNSLRGGVGQGICSAAGQFLMTSDDICKGGEGGVADVALGFIPGYDIARCGVLGCDSVGWALAAIAVVPAGKVLSTGGRVARRGAQSAANAVRLEKQLASQAQMGEVGQTMAGAGSRTVFRDAQKIAQQYGGSAADWVKKTSSSYLSRDGTRFETHWVENIKTGQRVEFKTKFPGGD